MAVATAVCGIENVVRIVVYLYRTLRLIRQEASQNNILILFDKLDPSGALAPELAVDPTWPDLNRYTKCKHASQSATDHGAAGSQQATDSVLYALTTVLNIQGLPMPLAS